MPIPVLTDHYSAQVIFKGQTGLPEDVYTNTFYFKNETFGQTPAQIADALAADLLEFYFTVPTGVASPVAIGSRFSSNTIAPIGELRVYDLGDPAPRYPQIRPMTWGAMSATNLPSEVCVCLSYVASENQPRNRGRIYLGPLGTPAVTNAGGRTVVGSSFLESALASAVRLKDKSSFTWEVWSPTSATMKPITGFWADNAFDTQRRRGERANLRYTAGSYLGQIGTPIGV